MFSAVFFHYKMIVLRQPPDKSSGVVGLAAALRGTPLKLCEENCMQSKIDIEVNDLFRLLTEEERQKVIEFAAQLKAERCNP